MTSSRVLWHSPQLDSSEHLRLQQSAEGYRLSGTVVLPIAARPALIRYDVSVDERWHCRAADVEVDGSALHRHFSLEVDSSQRWRVDGQQRADLEGCVDVDLGFTPGTNTLPIRRLGLDVDRRADLRAALVEWPGLSVVVSEQTYERLGEAHWRFASGTFSADLHVDPPSGLVLRYGDMWSARAHG